MRLLRPLLVLGAACTLVVSLSGQTVRVLSVSGEATIQTPGDSAPRTVKKGDTIVIGTKIITGDGARVILTPLPGVNSIISPKSEVVIERVSISNSEGAKPALHSAVLDLKTGAVTTDLQPTSGRELDYGVRTARGLAGARGTTYTVAIDIAGVQAIIVADGKISVTLADGRTVNLIPGQISITHADGSTQTVTSASQLSAGDQALAENWVEATLEALAEAIEQGIDIDSAALEDALRAAAELGIDISPGLQARLDHARDLLLERRLESLETSTGGTESGSTDTQTIVTENLQSQEQAVDDYQVSRDAYLLTLTDAQRAAFLALPDDVQRLLVLARDPAYTSFALDLFGEGQVRPVDAIRYAGNLSPAQRAAFFERSSYVQELLVVHPADAGLAAYALTSEGESGYPEDQLVGYFQTLTSGQRTTYRALSPSLRSTLAARNEPALTIYSLATGRTQAQVAFAVSLDSQTELPLFLDFPSTVQNKLVAANDPALNTYAFAEGRTSSEIIYAANLTQARRDVFLGLSPATQSLLITKATDTQLQSFALDLVDGSPRPEADIAYYSTLTSAQRGNFLQLPASTRDGLVAANDPGLTAYALASGRLATDVDYALTLPAERLALFLTFSAAAQSVLAANPADTALADFAYATNQSGGNLHSHETIVFYAGLSATDRATYATRPIIVQDAAAHDPAFAALALALDPQTSEPVYSNAALDHALTIASGVTRAAYLARSAEVRDLLAAIGKPALTGALVTDSTFDEPPTDADLRRNLSAYLALSAENQALFEKFAGGPTYAKIDNTPGPFEWSDASWTRTRNSFGALSTANQTRILNLGAINGLFDYSATFIEAALSDYDSSLSLAQRTAIQSAGWTRYFADYFAKDDFRSVFSLSSDLTAAQLSTLREFGVSPYAFLNFSRGNETAGLAAQTTTSPVGSVSSITDRLASLASLSATDRALLASLADGDAIIGAYLNGYYDPQTENYISPTYDEALSNALSFAREFSASDQKTLRQLGLSHFLLFNRGGDTLYVGDSPTTYRERLSYLLSVYSGLDAAQRDAVRDIGLFSAAFNELDLTAPNVTSILASWNGLSLATRDYLASSRDEGLNLFSLLGSSGVLSSLDSVISALSPAELGTLIELRATDTLLGAFSNETPPSLADLKSFLGFVGALSDTQRFTLRELGIVKEGNDREGLFMADRDGLNRLLQAYSELSGDIRAATRQLEPYVSYQTFTGRSFFFASDPGYDYTAYNVAFASPDDLHVGAVRRLAVYTGGEFGGTTFGVPAGKDIYLRASSLVDLNGVSFSSQVRAILIEAATINLASLDFPEGSVVTLNSKLGGMGTNNRYPNFDGTSMPGRVNFLYNVSYGGANNVMFDEASFDLHSRGNIVLGTLQNPALRPTYTPPPSGGQVQ